MLSVVRALSSIPATAREIEDALVWADFFRSHCPALMEASVLKISLILAPPVHSCYDCDSQLVSNHSHGNVRYANSSVIIKIMPVVCLHVAIIIQNS